MHGMRHGDFERPHFLRAAFIHAAAILHALGGQPHAGFEYRHHLGLELLGERNSIVDMVEVAVRDEKRIDTIELVSFGIRGIPLHPRVQNDYFSRFQAKLETSVA